MKHLKRLLCLALVFALCCAVGVFARAEPADAYKPVITKQPKAINLFIVGNNTKIILEVQARLPNDIEGALVYAWYDKDHPEEPIAFGAKAEIPVVIDFTKVVTSSKTYYVVVTSMYLDNNEQEKSDSIESNEATVIFFPSFLNYFKYFYGRPFLTSIVRFPFLLLFIPFYLFLILPLIHLGHWIDSIYDKVH